MQEKFSAFLHWALRDFRSSSELLIRIIEAAPNPYQNPGILTAQLALLERFGIIPGGKLWKNALPGENGVYILAHHAGGAGGRGGCAKNSAGLYPES